MLAPKVVPYFQGFSGDILQQDIARRRIARNVYVFLPPEIMQILSWPACSPDMSPIDNVSYFVEQHLTHTLTSLLQMNFGYLFKQ